MHSDDRKQDMARHAKLYSLGEVFRAETLSNALPMSQSLT
jgi:hypothetical protein